MPFMYNPDRDGKLNTPPPQPKFNRQLPYQQAPSKGFSLAPQKISTPDYNRPQYLKDRDEELKREDLQFTKKRDQQIDTSIIKQDELEKYLNRSGN